MNETIIAHYKKITQFLAECLGQDYEIVLVEVNKDDGVNIVFSHGNIKHKNMDLLKQIAKKAIQSKTSDYMSDVIKSKDVLKNYNGDSSVLYIEDENELLGMLWVGYNGERASKVIEKINDELRLLFNVVEKNNFIHENKNDYYGEDIGRVIAMIIDPIIRERNYPVTRLSFDEKMHLIEELKKQGVFLIKGAVSEAAIQLHSSEASIYRYLKKSKET